MVSYDADYFERGTTLGISGYADYRWLPELTIPLAHEIVTQLGIRKTDKTLDFGCAKGYLVKALRLLHHEAYGVDGSAYAIRQAPEDVHAYLRHVDHDESFGDDFAWVIAKDVLEHIPKTRLYTTLERLATSAANLFAIIPLGDGEKYVIPEMEMDKTHVIRETLEWWKMRFENAGFTVVSAKYQMPHMKENWAHYEKGNGFFTLRSR